MSISKIFIPNSVIVLTNERYKTYRLGNAQGVRLWGAGGTEGVQNFFFKHGHVAYQIEEDEEQNRMQVKFSS